MTDERVRIDKWLWAARFFKTRAAAQQAIEGGHVKVAGERVKPAREVRPGDELTIQIGLNAYTIRVSGISDRQVPLPLRARSTRKTKRAASRARMLQRCGAIRTSLPRSAPAGPPSRNAGGSTAGAASERLKQKSTGVRCFFAVQPAGQRYLRVMTTFW